MYRSMIIVLILATTTTALQIRFVGCPSIIPRATWGARSPKRATYIGDNLSYAIIHETGGPQCFSDLGCANTVKSIQDYHMNGENNSDDINYNFLVDQFGNIYEGRGWEYKGNHEVKHNSNSIGIALIGSYKNIVPSVKAIKAIKDLLECGLRFQKLTIDYKLMAHRQLKENDCPGIKFYELIKTWRNWSSEDDFFPSVFI